MNYFLNLKTVSTSSDDLPQRLLDISLVLIRIIPICQLIFGTFGNIMNILIFTRRSLCNNPCSFYFLASSINNLFVLYVALLTRLLSSGWQIDPSNTNTVLCKLRVFFVYSSICLMQWFLVLASVDRYFSTSEQIRYRQLSSLRIVKRTVVSIILIIAVVHFHILIWWNVNVDEENRYCNIFTSDYEIAFQIFFLSSSCIIPVVFMFIFGILMILNVRKLYIRIAAQNEGISRENLRSKDRQLITMLLVQVIIIIFCTSPFAAANLFDMFVRYQTTVAYNTKIKLFFENICRIILYFNPIIGFYIYILFSRTFRVETKRMIKKIVRYANIKFCLEKCVSKFHQNQINEPNQSVCRWAKKVRHNHNSIKY